MKKLTFAVIAMATALAFVPAAVASGVCPSSGTHGGYNNTITNVPGTQDGTCGANSAVNLQVDDVSTGYAKVTWTPGTPGIPTGLTLGDLTGINASVVNSGATGNQPYFMITFDAPDLSLGQTNSADQILMLEFQPSTLSGTDMSMSASTTLFNMYDNTQSFYLNGANGQQVVHSLDDWFGIYSGLSSELITGIRIGIGNAGACDGPCPASPESLTINSLDVTSTVSAPESSSLPMLFLAGFVLACVIFQKARQSGLFLAA